MSNQKFEQFANEVHAEAQATRAILQCLIVQILGAHPKATDLFQGLQENVLARLDKEATLQPDEKGRRKFATLVRECAVEIFREMEPVFGVAPSQHTKN